MPKTFWFPKRRAKVPIFLSQALAHPVFPAAETSANAAIIPEPIMSGKMAKAIVAGSCSTTANAALDWIIARVGGTALQDGSGWFRFRLEDGLNSLGRIRCYWDKDEELRVLICMPNSGAILDYASFDVEIGEVLQPGHYYSTRFLNFMLNGLDNLQSNQTLSQKELNDDLTP